MKWNNTHTLLPMIASQSSMYMDKCVHTYTSISIVPAKSFTCILNPCLHLLSTNRIRILNIHDRCWSNDALVLKFQLKKTNLRSFLTIDRKYLSGLKKKKVPFTFIKLFWSQTRSIFPRIFSFYQPVKNCYNFRGDISNFLSSPLVMKNNHFVIG